MNVTIYYNDVFVSEKPFKVYPNCPNVSVDVEKAREFAQAKLDSGEWHSFLIPELTDHPIEFLNQLQNENND
jgi:hypothetical protein